MVSLK